jgi:CBS domain containing-hemolysin-like protein
MTSFNHVTCLPLDATLDESLLETIKKRGYSRIPLCQHENEKTVIGIFLTKSLVGYTACGESIISAIKNNKIQVRPAIYFFPDTKVNSVCKQFSKGVSHMGVVCDTKETANYLMKESDRILTHLQEGTYEFDNLEEHTLLGILTLENVIERILNLDIHDEKDYDRKMKENQ